MAIDTKSPTSSVVQANQASQTRNGSDVDPNGQSPRHVTDHGDDIEGQLAGSVRVPYIQRRHENDESDQRADMATKPDEYGINATAQISAIRVAPNTDKRSNSATCTQSAPQRIYIMGKGQKQDGRTTKDDALAPDRTDTEPADVTCRNRLAIYMDIEFAYQALKLEEEYLLKQSDLADKWEEATETALGKVTGLVRMRTAEVRDKLGAFRTKQDGGMQFQQLLEAVCETRERFQPLDPVLKMLDEYEKGR